jgi:hypothetical protein
VQAWEYYELSGFANSLTSPLPFSLLSWSLLVLARSPSVDYTHKRGIVQWKLYIISCYIIYHNLFQARLICPPGTPSSCSAWSYLPYMLSSCSLSLSGSTGMFNHKQSLCSLSSWGSIQYWLLHPCYITSSWCLSSSRAIVRLKKITTRNLWTARQAIIKPQKSHDTVPLSQIFAIYSTVQYDGIIFCIWHKKNP